jgi:hypothetical protein
VKEWHKIISYPAGDMTSVDYLSSKQNTLGKWPPSYDWKNERRAMLAKI